MGPLVTIIPSGELVYAVGSVIVLYNITAGKQRFYTQHGDNDITAYRIEFLFVLQNYFIIGADINSYI